MTDEQVEERKKVLDEKGYDFIELVREENLLCKAKNSDEYKLFWFPAEADRILWEGTYKKVKKPFPESDYFVKDGLSISYDECGCIEQKVMYRDNVQVEMEVQ